MNMQLNCIHKIQIDSLAFGGEGVGRIDGMVAFVPFAAQGETMEIEIVEVKKKYCRGIIKKIISPSLSRIVPQCRYYEICGGCQYQHLAYQEELAVKQQQVRDVFERIGKIKDVKIREIIPSPKETHYRCKSTFHIGMDDNGNPVMGFRPGKSREVVDIEQCEIAAEEINKSLKKFKADLRNKNPEFIPESLTLWSNWQYDETELEIPREYIVRKIRDKSIKVPAGGFFQANELLIERLISLVEEKTGLKGNEILLDAYCGSGLFSLFLAEKAGLIYGIEQDSRAANCAIHNCRKAGGSGRVKIIEGDAANIIKYKLLKEDVKIDTALIDPPRIGCEESALYNLSLLKPRKILYLSCNPATQARDVKYLVSQGYALNELQPLDMFPRTKHIEVLAEMERREGAGCKIQDIKITDNRK